MYMLLSAGKHPLFNSDDTKESLVDKIQSPSWEFSSNFHHLAKDFFLKLATPSQSERYNVGQALLHPWITRRFEDEIPMTFNQRRKIFEKEQNVIKVDSMECYILLVCQSCATANDAQDQ